MCRRRPPRAAKTQLSRLAPPQAHLAVASPWAAASPGAAWPVRPSPAAHIPSICTLPDPLTRTPRPLQEDSDSDHSPRRWRGRGSSTGGPPPVVAGGGSGSASGNSGKWGGFKRLLKTDSYRIATKEVSRPRRRRCRKPPTTTVARQLPPAVQALVFFFLFFWSA